MLLIRITGAQLRAGRALAGLTIEGLATRARICRHTVTKWEGSANAVPEANVSHLSRAIGALEAEGIRFSDDGVFLQACRTGTNRGHGSLGGHSVMNEAAIDKVFDTVAPSNAKADTVWVGLALAARTPPKAKTRQKAVVAC